jgi:hypothetical protein
MAVHTSENRAEPPERPGSGPPVTPRGERSDHHPVNWLLLVPLALTLFPPIYNSIDPALGDVPFFYWYQMAAIIVSVLVTLVVYRKTRA